MGLESSRTYLHFQDPFEKTPNWCKEQMSRLQKFNCSRQLRKIDVERFVSELLEVIFINLKSETKGEEDMRSGETSLSPMMHYTRSPEIPKLASVLTVTYVQCKGVRYPLHPSPTPQGDVREGARVEFKCLSFSSFVSNSANSERTALGQVHTQFAAREGGGGGGCLGFLCSYSMWRLGVWG